jgi:hypothetical protein
VGFVLQGMKPAAAQAAEWWQGTVLISCYKQKVVIQISRWMQTLLNRHCLEKNPEKLN